MLHGLIVKLIDAGFCRVSIQGVKKKKTNSCGKKRGGVCVAINNNMTPAKLYVQEVIK